MALLLSNLSYLGIAKETTQGTYVAPTDFLPVDKSTLKVDDNPARLRDETLRGNAALLQGIYDGVKFATVAFSGPFFPDVCGHLLKIIGPDTIAGSNPYTHTFKLTSAQPSSYSLADFDVVEARGFVGQVLDTLTLKFDINGFVTYDASFTGWASAAQSTPSNVQTAVSPLLGWNTSVTVAGGANARVISAEFTFKRNVTPVFTMANTQNPKTVWAGPLMLDGGKIRAIVEDNTELNYFLNNTQNALVFNANQSASAALALTATKGAWTNALIDRSGDFIAIDLTVDAIYNATDTGPGAVVLTNAKSSAY